MYNDYLSEKILKKFPNPTEIVNVYSKSIFADFYHATTDRNAFYNDLDFFRKEISKSDLTIELASGTGRILCPLLDEGFNMLGIEKEKSMINVMSSKYRKFVINNDIFNFEENRNIYKKAHCFIIPATSISLFSLDQIKKFFEYIVSVNNNFSVIFDIIDINSLIVDPPKKIVNNQGLFYYTNFPKNDFIIYNLYHVNSNSIGFSFKYNHSLERLKQVLSTIGFEITLSKIDLDYFMVKAVYENE
ncbi:hypothetical protein MTR10_11150 [Staphylococcus agnetis]|uniref:hypothetical protein n=1 Tax=Staphylococcus agnetis TaxID=985762 RepID=UPI00208ED19F|nr:hypothetical protein [Staphylococcus agnetis]MCO4349241.1 hypothetical protein [Staphylococcus agnetis]MCO4360876.1 hypothetical protein [Staphylococcus agnetis]MCO4372619.1 hypothetical protein [Staphylococcus agnetis]